MGLCPLDPVEQCGKVGAPVVQIVPLLEGDVSSPVTDLDIAVKCSNVENGLCKLESYLRRRGSKSGLLLERPIH